MEALFGEEIRDLKYYWLRHLTLNGMELVVSRTGWSSELGYEIYLQDGSRGSELWELIMAAGAPFGLKPGHTSSIRRIEGGMLSYHADMDILTNPFELNLDRLVNVDVPHHFIGKEALTKIKQEGVSRRQIGLVIECPMLQGPNTIFWPIEVDSKMVGKVTSAVYSPRLEKNIALAMIESEHSHIGQNVKVHIDGEFYEATICETPFFDPKKQITKAS